MNETVGKPFKVSSLTEAVELKAKLDMTEKAIHKLRVDEVIDVSITLERGRVRSCINGPLSKNTTTPNYDEVFDYFIDAIEYGYVDHDIIMSIWHGYPTKHNVAGEVLCAFSH